MKFIKSQLFHYLFFALLIVLLISTIKFLAHKNQIVTSEIVLPEEKLPNDWLYRQRAYPGGSIDARAYSAAFEYRKEKSTSSGLRNKTQWEFCGPTNLSGRVTDIEMTESEPGILYVGTASGGIFKSPDIGATWIPIFDDEKTLSIGDLAIGQDENIIYVGTGEANAGGGSIAYDGNGMYKSIDAGLSWMHLGLDSIGSVGKVVINPLDDDICFIAAMGYLFENNPDRGLFRTLDGGQTWENVLFINDSTGVIDIAIHPHHPDTIYAATWERIRRVNRRSYGGPSSGIYRSIDGGDTWLELRNGLPPSAGRIGITISNSNPEILYATYTHETTGYTKGIYKSTDHGDTWEELDDFEIFDQPYMWWFGKIYCDPHDPDIVYVPGFFMYKSTDGGYSWFEIFSGSHVDHHAVYINPKNTDMVLIGNDGGVYMSQDGGIADYGVLKGIPNFQFYTCEIDNSFSNRLYGGAQDNGTVRTFSANPDYWAEIYYGDGFRVLVDPSNNQYVYAEFQYGELAKSTNGGLSFDQATDGIAGNDRKNWNTPISFNPLDPSILYYGSNRLYKSTDRANSWSLISPNLTNNSISNNIIYGTITSIDISSLDDDIIIVGTDDGNVQVTTNGGTNWTSVSSTLPNRWVTCVATDPIHVNTAYVSFSGFRFGENIGHLYKTTDLGDTWSDISGDLPDIPINDLIITPLNGALFIATDIGVYYTINAGINWELLGVGLPNVILTDIDYHLGDNFLLAASYGRGMYKISLDDIPTSLSDLDVEPKIEIQAYPNPFSESTTIKITTDLKRFYNISIYNLSGVLLKNLNTDYLEAGTHVFHLEATQMPSGLYFCKVSGKVGQSEKSLLLIKG